jgi:hypothetical protein
LSRLAATAAQMVALLWLAVGLQILHPLFHHHADAELRHGSHGAGRWSRNPAGQNASPHHGASLSAPCPVCSLSAVGGASYVSSPTSICSPAPHLALRYPATSETLSTRDGGTHRARAPPLAS